MKYQFLALVIALFIIACGTEDPEISNVEEFNSFLESEIESQGIPALSVVIFKEDEIIHQSSLGDSNIDENLALQAEDLFLLASVSKVITATALLQLFDQGLFELDDPINQYLPFSVIIPGETTDITFRHLLTHTSGIADGSALDDQYYFGEDSPIELRDFLEAYLVPGGSFYNENENFHNFEPGTESEYSNEGSALIGVLVEQISSQSFNAYCKQNIFAPLGMNHTFWRLDESFDSGLTLVQPYNLSGNEFEAIQHYTFTDYPNGGLRSTGLDLAKLLSAWTQNGSSNDYQLIKASTIDMMLTPQIPFIDPEMGLHLFLLDKEKGLWGHDGGEQGVATIMAFSPTTKIGAIILCNQGEANLDDILRLSYQFGTEL